MRRTPLDLPPALPVSRRRVWLPALIGAGILGLAAHLFVFVWVPIPGGEGGRLVPSAPYADYLGQAEGSNRLLREQSVLLDSRPLFVPTRWNVGSSLQDIARLRDEAELFARYQPMVQLRSDGWRPLDRPGLAFDLAVEDLLRARFQVHPLEGFGEFQAPDPPVLQARPGAVGLENLSGGPSPPSFDLPPLEPAVMSGRLWSPAVFMLEIDLRSSGGRPLRVSGSSVPEWDAALTAYLASPEFQHRLAPGYYRITIGP